LEIPARRTSPRVVFVQCLAKQTPQWIKRRWGEIENDIVTKRLLGTLGRDVPQHFFTPVPRINKHGSKLVSLAIALAFDLLIYSASTVPTSKKTVPGKRNPLQAKHQIELAGKQH